MYDLILADPPWHYRHSKSNSRRIERKYPTMTDAEIRQLPVRSLVASGGAALFLWATFPKLPEALRVMDDWGFDYKTGEGWFKKPGPGMGYYFRSREELLLVGTCGEMRPPPPERRPSGGIRGGYRGHTKKPEGAYEQIEFMYPDATKLELFATEKRPGWTSIGYDLGSCVSTFLGGGGECTSA